AYKTGRGKILVRGKFNIEVNKNGAESIVFTEVPYGVNTRTLCERIGALARDKAIEGISAINDESSDRTGMRIVIHLKRGAITKIVINQLFSKTELQSSFGVINLALVKGRPQVLNLKQLIQCFVDHRDEVITRRTKFELAEAKHREHILEALIIAIDAIDEVIKIIRGSRDEADAKAQLQKRFDFDEEQTQAIVDMPLKRLTHLKIDELRKEMAEIKALIAYLEDLLAHHEKILAKIKEETNELAAKYGDDRRTDIISDEVEQINIEDLIKKEEVIILISNLGYIKRISASAYKAQGRGGKGSNSAKLVEDDFINQLFTASTHDYVMFISNEGKAFWLKVHEIPEASRTSRGAHIKSLLQVSPNEEITTVVPMKEMREDQYLFMVTANGVVKKVQTSEFVNAKTRGIIGIRLDEGDKLVTAQLTSGNDEVVLITRKGKALRIGEEEVRAMGRASRGVTGIHLMTDDEVAAALQVKQNEKMLIMTEFGYGKRVDFDEFSRHGRGTGGQKVYEVKEKTGEIIGAITVSENEEMVCVTSQGKTLRVKASEISEQSRTSQGVRILNIDQPDMVIGLDKIAESENDKD
ncbi:MAG: DNA gyrase subunit A, partial [Spirochaetaceae bacterium]|nr:DNA gyrase subunit A [Spirochaetaceae bacterium]